MNMGVVTTGGDFARSYSDHRQKIQPMSKQSVSDDAMELVCEICHSVIASLCKEGRGIILQYFRASRMNPHDSADEEILPL